METLEVVKKVYETFRNGDIDGFKSLLSSEIQWNIMGNLPHSGTFYGPDDVLENSICKLQESFPDFEVTPKQFWQSDNTVVVECDFSSEKMQGAGWFGMHKLTVLKGQITHFQDYFDTQQFANVLK